MEKVNILLVDDQPSKLLSYQAVLSDLGENLVLARSGRDALQALLKEEFALILLDVIMPEMDGFETAALIRQRPRLADTPIIFLSSYTSSDMDRVRGYQMGAVDFVFAPVVPEILRAKVSVFVELFRKRVQLGHANERLRAEIIERKKAQEQALHAERLATIGRMVAALAHESRNALQQIQAAIEMLERRIKSEPEKSLLAEIQKAQDRVLRLLEEVRGYAAPIELSLEIHNLGDLWHNAWTELTALRGQRDVSLQVHADGVDLRCRVDPKPAGRLFRHVLEHALTACPSPGRIDVRFRAVEHKGAPALCARVEDNGPGLSEEQRQHIFEPFPPTKKPGPGLGMAIAKRIVDAHGGQIAIANGTGTAIEVLLPKGSI